MRRASFPNSAVFFNIEESSIDWDGETSSDGGESWELRWRIHYERRI